MDDKIAFSKFAEIDLGAVTFRTTQAQKPSRMDCESSEQLRSREHNEISRRKRKSTRKCALHKIHALYCAAHDLAEALDLAFRLKVNDDPRVVRAPFFQALDKLRAFGL